ncbi:Hypothetical predicted protein [Paramuricea clavata]|uniref:Uncharacterized protein n=1 Tax=Paramuricea clavata TaxID=317549 RepID=A0A6S7HEP4_PARCT|nr:Hypothetical predicted protein [Paramuricea clavata]
MTKKRKSRARKSSVSNEISKSQTSKGRNLLCVLCKGTHHLERCHKFRAQSLQQRRDLIKSKRVCHACLSPGHFVNNCRGAQMCGVEGCQRRHHPLLHSSEKEVKPPQADPGAESGSAPENNRSTQDMQSGGSNVSGVALGCKEDVKGMSSIHEQLESLYNSEFSESTADLKECLSIEDRRAKAMMDSSVKLKDGHYEIDLPWKYSEPTLPNDRSMAEKRLGYLKKRLERGPTLHAKYKATMEEYISKGHAKRVQADRESQFNKTVKR